MLPARRAIVLEDADVLDAGLAFTSIADPPHDGLPSRSGRPVVAVSLTIAQVAALVLPAIRVVIAMRPIESDRPSRSRASAHFRGYRPDRRREPRMSGRINRPVPDDNARRVMAEIIVASPVLRRPDRSCNETSTAVGTDVAQYAIHACRAECALVAADAGIDRRRWQRGVAVFAAWSQFEHDDSPGAGCVRHGCEGAVVVGRLALRGHA